MHKCQIKGCLKFTTYKNTTQKYCEMHLARIRRHGYPELKTDAYASLEKLPHVVIDDYIRNNCQKMEDGEIVQKLRVMGFETATIWTVGYRRRKLGGRKYLRGEIQKHKAWVRVQAIKKYGKVCELCSYKLAIDTHHIVPKHMGGHHEINNLMVICPNCHALATRKLITLKDRRDIPKISKTVIKKIKSLYKNI